MTYYNPSQRITLLDTIRGIALLGILLMNIQVYTLFDFLTPVQVRALHWDNSSTLVPTQFLLDIFIRGQFYSIYSFLFGLGCYLMLEKNTRLGLNGRRLYLRRLMVMLVFSAIHCALWFGDVLHMYAILGVPLIFFYDRKVSVIIKWAAGIFLFGILLDVCTTIFFPRVLPSSVQGVFSQDRLHIINTFQHGTFREIMDTQYGLLMKRLTATVRNNLNAYQHTFVLFLLGLIAGKTRFFHRITELRPAIKRTVLILLPFALATKVIASLSSLDVHFFSPEKSVYEQLLTNIMRFTGMLLTTLVYVGGLTLLLHNNHSRLSGWIGNAGRLGLTNYLAQTVICMLLFYPFGLGLTGKLTLYQSLLLALMIYIVQVIYSNIWLRYYSMGPLEAVWRRFTYGRQGGINKSV
ncbi:DUF418 domain-containing protein [Chitinophaga ginsengisoli]|uniref:DUF418 domain-containing protein n=1 Tax=Chitinophaga ginsengisoli TaxID=363837 RepID=A0A2P8GLW4_9BACT|nr:DUF418 domain-containing protein [Chitinophaga ginsengisoli]PSL34952.1 uncharacterized protein CLV42_102526 [Chitinophaga ginsengisoli]